MSKILKPALYLNAVIVTVVALVIFVFHSVTLWHQFGDSTPIL
jgi:hypothetical protein